MKSLATITLLGCLVTACAALQDAAEPVVNKAAFQGFDFSGEGSRPTASLLGHEYQTADGSKVTLNSCEQAEKTDASMIAEFDYFRFRQLLLSCKAVALYSEANASRVSHFPDSFDKAFYEALPATVVPLLSKEDKDQRKHKTLIEYDKDTVVTTETEQGVKALTAEDEIYLTVLARGDFTNDGVEDVLIKSEWFGVNSFGKHLDLLILSRIAAAKNTEINWRWNELR